MLEPQLQMTLAMRGANADEGEEDEAHRGVACPGCGDIEIIVGFQQTAGGIEAIDHEPQTDDRNEREKTLIRPLAQASLQSVAWARKQHGEQMDANENHYSNVKEYH